MYKITKRNDRNTYQVRLHKFNNKRKGGFKNSKDAKDWAENYIINHNAKELSLKSIKGKDAINYYLNKQEKRYKNNIIGLTQYKSKQRFAEAFLHIKIDNIKLRDWSLPKLVSNERSPLVIIEQILDQVNSWNRSTKTKRDYFYAFKGIFKYFDDMNFTHKCAMGGEKSTHFEQPRQSKKKQIEISKDIIYKIILHTKPQYKFITEFAACTGIRQGELLELRWMDINFDRQIIDVERCWRRCGTIGNTKSEKGVRIIKIPTTLLVKLKEWKIKLENTKDNGLVFPGKNNGRLQSKTLLKSITDACKKAKVQRIVWHDLRHYYASSLLKEYGHDLNYVTNALGHSSITVTKTRYEHNMYDKKENEMHAEKLDKLFY